MMRLVLDTSSVLMPTVRATSSDGRENCGREGRFRAILRKTAAAIEKLVPKVRLELTRD